MSLNNFQMNFHDFYKVIKKKKNINIMILSNH